MGTIVCQNCNETIEHFEYEKVVTLYSKCNGCGCESHEKPQGK